MYIVVDYDFEIMGFSIIITTCFTDEGFCDGLTWDPGRRSDVN